MLSEIVQTLLTLWGGKDRHPTEETTNQHLKILRNEQWFQPLFSEHTELFLKNKELRYFIGATNPQEIISNEKKKLRFEEDLTHLITLIRKKHE